MLERVRFHGNGLFLLAGLFVLTVALNSCDGEEVYVSGGDPGQDTRSRAFMVETFDGGQTW